MKFPKIEHIDDVLHVAKANPEFKIKEGPWYTSIDYQILSGPEVFDDPIARELRGIKFYSGTGKIAARPLHKFFNVGECSLAPTWEYLIEHEGYYAVAEKFDGSMVHTIWNPVENRAELHTKAGFTDIAERATKFWYASHEGIVVPENLTMIYEFTSPCNRIVVDYKGPSLTLLAVRDNVTGEYRAARVDEELNVDTVKKLVEDDMENEGVVVYSGFVPIAKIKYKEYLRKHKLLDVMRSPKAILKAIVDKSIDDIYGDLSEHDKNTVDEYKRAYAQIRWETARAVCLFLSYAPPTRKEYAINAGSALNTYGFSVAMRVFEKFQELHQDLDGEQCPDNIVKLCNDAAEIFWENDVLKRNCKKILESEEFRCLIF